MNLLREASRRVFYLARTYPAVTVAGPRHSGKTTLVKMLFPRHNYVNLETPDTRESALRSPADFLKRHTEGRDLIVDEFLRAPELLSRIQTTTENSRRPGQFILITSHLPPRTGTTRGGREPEPAPTPARHPATQILLPLSLSELGAARVNLERDEYIHRGFMPRIYKENADPGHIYRNYLAFYASHDARRLANVDNQAAFERFLRLMAERVGQIINPNSLAAETGVPKTTLTTWIHALEAGFIIFRLPCYFKNYGRDITKIPKFYFTDTGMAACLLGITDPGQVFRNPLVGNLFENMVVAEALKGRCNAGRNTNLYYFRSHSHNNIEIDLIAHKRHTTLPIEIKYAPAADPAFTKNIKAFGRLDKNIGSGCVVYCGKTKKEKPGEPRYVNFKEVGKLVTDVNH